MPSVRAAPGGHSAAKPHVRRDVDWTQSRGNNKRCFTREHVWWMCPGI